MTFTNILFAIIILVVVVYGIIYYFKMQLKSQITQLKERRDAMMNISVSDQFFLLKNMSLSGQTKRKYESLNAEWQTLTNFQFTEIESALVSAEQFAEQINFVKTKRSVDQVTELLEETEQQVQNLSGELSELVKIEQDNNTQNEVLLERYNTARKNILNHSFDYGPAIETLEKNLQYIELNFTKYSESMLNGDYLEAHDVLKTIDSDMTSLEEILEKIPSMYEQIKEQYEADIEDLRTGYQRMVENRFNFEGLDILEKIDEIQEKLDGAKTSIKSADLSEARTMMDKAERDINSLYDLMEEEHNAKAYVVKNLQQLRTKLESVADEGRYAAIEVDRIAQSYILHENEEERIAGLTGRIQQEFVKFRDLEQEIESDSVVYTAMKEVIKKIRKRIEEIEDGIQHVVEGISSLPVSEREAKKSLDTYELDLRNIKRRVEKSHLPGLSEDFYALFYNVTDQIEYLAQQLNRVRIDMHEINDLEKDLASELEVLEELTDDIVDSANLTEYMIQQSNRYRYDFPEIDQAIREAQYLFHEEYRYSDSLAIIEKALRRVDQEAPTQVRRMYHQEKQRRDY